MELKKVLDTKILLYIDILKYSQLIFFQLVGGEVKRNVDNTTHKKRVAIDLKVKCQNPTVLIKEVEFDRPGERRPE